MKVLVTGSRDWADVEVIQRELSKLPPGSIVVHGAATGADTLADQVSKSLGFETRAYPADWDTQGKSAGPIRNSTMLRKEHRSGDSLDLCLAFTRDLDRSRGTKDMVLKARAKGVRVEIHSA